MEQNVSQNNATKSCARDFDSRKLVYLWADYSISMSNKYQIFL